MRLLEQSPWAGEGDKGDEVIGTGISLTPHEYLTRCVGQIAVAAYCGGIVIGIPAGVYPEAQRRAAMTAW